MQETNRYPQPRAYATDCQALSLSISRLESLMRWPTSFSLPYARALVKICVSFIRVVLDELIPVNIAITPLQGDWYSFPNFVGLGLPCSETMAGISAVVLSLKVVLNVLKHAFANQKSLNFDVPCWGAGITPYAVFLRIPISTTWRMD
jgi:hypothetical protein